MSTITKPIIIGVTCTAMALSGASAYVWYENQRPQALEVYVIPFKSGQALFIRTPNDKRILVDGGPNSEIIKHISDILPFYSRRIDSVVVTKPDFSHVSGLVDVVDRYSVGEVVVPAVTLQSIGLATSSDLVYETFLDVVKQHNIPIREVVIDDEWVVNQDATSSVKIRTLFPAQPDKFKYSKASGPELVLDISYGSTSVVYLGDVTTKVQKFIASSTATSTISALVMSKNPIASNLALLFMEKFSPDNIIYSKAITKSSVDGVSINPASSKKKVVDPLLSIPTKNRFNIREVGIVRAVSDRVSLKVNKL